MVENTSPISAILYMYSHLSYPLKLNLTHSTSTLVCITDSHLVFQSQAWMATSSMTPS